MNVAKSVVLASFLVSFVLYSSDYVSTVVKKYESKPGFLAPSMAKKVNGDVVSQYKEQKDGYPTPYGLIKKHYDKKGQTTQDLCGLMYGARGTEVAPFSRESGEEYIKKDTETMEKLGWFESKTTNEKANAVVILYDTYSRLLQSFWALKQQAETGNCPDAIYFITPANELQSVIPKETAATINALVKIMLPDFDNKPLSEKIKPSTPTAVFAYIKHLKPFKEIIDSKDHQVMSMKVFRRIFGKPENSVFIASSSYAHDLAQMIVACAVPTIHIVPGCSHYEQELEQFSCAEKEISLHCPAHIPLDQSLANRVIELIKRNYQLSKIFSWFGKTHKLKLDWEKNKLCFYMEDSNGDKRYVAFSDTRLSKINEQHIEQVDAVIDTILSDQI